MGFVGVVKTATRRFPVAYLSLLEIQDQVEHHGLVLRDVGGISTMVSFVWIDHNRRNFIATSSSLQEGLAYIQHCWRQVDQTPNSDAERVELSVPQPKQLKYTIALVQKFTVTTGIDRIL